MKWRGIHTWPNTLVIHLARWRDNGGGKNDAEIDFALQESLGGSTYRLMAVCEHQGDSSEGGHYVSYTRRNDSWLLCDDSEVSVVHPDDVRGVQAYVLIYQKLP